MPERVLIVDDEELFREDLAELLRHRDYECLTASSAEEALQILNSFDPAIILCDIAMPGKSGLELLDDIARLLPEASVIMMTAFGTLQTAVEAFRKGAADYVMKPLVVEDVLQKMERLINYKRLSQEVKFLRRELSQDAASLALVGQSGAMKHVLDLADQVASVKSTVLLTGESGTGKELVARAIHSMSATGGGTLESAGNAAPFVAINCAGIPSELFESELFGHVKGSFTGALRDREGHFELARDGTILLDEVAEMPLALQSKLLRVLEEKEFVRVGGSKTIPLSARIIAATNKDLHELVEKNEFREDLYYRLAVFEIPLPALRERRSDIPLLTEYFVHKFNEEMKRQTRGLEGEAMRNLLAHSWPGNVRELRNVIERAMILNRGEYISAADLPSDFQDAAPPETPADDLRDAMRAYEVAHILRVLGAAGWNKEETARRLRVNPSTLYRKMTGLGIPHEDPASS